MNNCLTRMEGVNDPKSVPLFNPPSNGNVLFARNIPIQIAWCMWWLGHTVYSILRRGLVPAWTNSQLRIIKVIVVKLPIMYRAPASATGETPQGGSQPWLTRCQSTASSSSSLHCTVHWYVTWTADNVSICVEENPHSRKKNCTHISHPKQTLWNIILNRSRCRFPTRWKTC